MENPKHCEAHSTPSPYKQSRLLACREQWPQQTPSTHVCNVLDLVTGIKHCKYLFLNNAYGLLIILGFISNCRAWQKWKERANGDDLDWGITTDFDYKGGGNPYTQTPQFG
jgi:hypothetical protein